MVEDPLRVLAVTNLWPDDGGSYRGIFVKEQVEALRRLGHTVHVEVVAQARGKLDYALAVPRVLRRAREYDLVHFHYGLTALAAPLLGRVPSVLSVYGSDANVSWQRRITRLGKRHTDARLYVSPRLRSTMDDPAGRVIPMGVDLGLFRPIDRTSARGALGIDGDGPVVLFGGDPANQVKGYDVFRAVLDRLGARELLLPGQSREAVPLKFAAADLLLFTSRRGAEGSPGVVKEAVAMGLPVVSVDVGDVRETLAGVRPSAVVEFGGDLVPALTDRCAHVLRAGTRSNGRETAARFAWDTVARRVSAVYEDVVLSRAWTGSTNC